MTVLTCASNNKPVSLGKQIASSGEGEVWETNLSGILAKIYHNPTTERIEKLKVMLANPPADPMASQNHVSIAFPQDLLKNQTGAVVGFLMRAIRDSRELHTVYNPSLRKKKAAGFNWYYLHATALNTAWIIQAIHEKGYVLGDIKSQNILVSDRALVAIIDTDSFQVRDSHTGKVYRCTVGSEGFTPVELLGQDFSTTNQTEIHDRFRLGVLIHYLLFGYHPFSGQWIGSGESPEQTELIRKGFWYGGQNSLIRPSQNTIPLDVVHPEIKKCFLKCFNDGHAAPHSRPSAEEWHKALEVAINELTVCGKVDSHHYSRNYGKCYWCERKAKLGVDIFPGGSGTAKIPTARRASKVAAANKSIESIFPGFPSTTKAPSDTSSFKILAAYKTLELVKHSGQKVTVVGRVASTRHLFHDCINILFINFESYANSISGYSPFTTVIFSEGLQNLSRVKGLEVDDFNNWVGEYLQITGILETQENDVGCRVPQIVLKEAAQMKLITKDEAAKLLSITSIPISSSQARHPSAPPQVTPQYRQQSVTQAHPFQNPPPSSLTLQSSGNVQHNGITWNFLFQWVLGSSIIWTVAWSLLTHPGTFIFLRLTIFLFFSSMIGTMQWIVLRQRVSRVRWWVSASTSGWAAGLLATVIIFLISAMSGMISSRMFAKAEVGLTMIGAIVATFQWRFLQQQGFKKASWWVLPSTVGWTMGFIASVNGYCLIGGVLFSLVTGIALDWLLRHNAIQQSN